VPNLEIYQRADRRWAWRLRAGNGAIIATDGGQGYEKRADCARIADAVISGMYAEEGCAAAARFDRIREALPWWESAGRPHADGSLLARTIRAIVDPPTESDR
jgi:uncharacterized protein YegP (UPF0339 family)